VQDFGIRFTQQSNGHLMLALWKRPIESAFMRALGAKDTITLLIAAYGGALDTEQ